MIAKKDHGVIAGEQKSRNGEIIWSKQLPKTCRLSKYVYFLITKRVRYFFRLWVYIGTASLRRF